MVSSELMKRPSQGATNLADLSSFSLQKEKTHGTEDNRSGDRARRGIHRDKLTRIRSAGAEWRPRWSETGLYPYAPRILRAARLHQRSPLLLRPPGRSGRYKSLCQTGRAGLRAAVWPTLAARRHANASATIRPPKRMSLSLGVPC